MQTEKSTCAHPAGAMSARVPPQALRSFAQYVAISFRQSVIIAHHETPCEGACHTDARIKVAVANGCRAAAADELRTGEKVQQGHTWAPQHCYE